MIVRSVALPSVGKKEEKPQVFFPNLLSFRSSSVLLSIFLERKNASCVLATNVTQFPWNRVAVTRVIQQLKMYARRDSKVTIHDVLLFWKFWVEEFSAAKSFPRKFSCNLSTFWESCQSASKIGYLLILNIFALNFLPKTLEFSCTQFPRKRNLIRLNTLREIQHCF